MIVRQQIFDDETPPPDLRHRESQIQELIRLLHRARERTQGVLITGPSGVGKTVLGRTVLERYAHEYGVDWAWIQTLGLTTGDVFRKAIRAAGGDVSHNTPNAELPHRLREAISGDYLLLLDEGDDLAGTGTLRQLDDVPGVEVVVVCHEPDDWLARAEHDVRQRLHGGKIELTRYGVDELADILGDRARVGLVDGAISREQLEEIADGVAGVAREGIQTLRSAAELASERDHGRIRSVDVEDGFERAKRRIRKAHLNSLPFHHLVLYELIRSNGGITGRDLHRLYEDRSEELYAGRKLTPISDRARRTKLQKLQEYELIERERLDHRWLYTPMDPSLQADCNVSVSRLV
ncbi:Cdc6/Cdc18 family protein [Halorubrum rubrum]|uniref:Cdc6/Cdc18 family protein n=1 Tax=Halorubrum rubrum TaxID=1126240 RepID=A0ABD5R329_9EURY|nr:AAA family ATPase [Halorubrum rubrum]